MIIAVNHNKDIIVIGFPERENIQILVVKTIQVKNDKN